MRALSTSRRSTPRIERDVSAANALAQRLAHIAFPLSQLTRQLDRGVEKPVIHRANLDGDAHAADVALRRPEAGHAFYHIESPARPSDDDV